MKPVILFFCGAVVVFTNAALYVKHNPADWEFWAGLLLMGGGMFLCHLSGRMEARK